MAVNVACHTMMQMKNYIKISHKPSKGYRDTSFTSSPVYSFVHSLILFSMLNNLFSQDPICDKFWSLGILHS
jgi:hypothetical protein